jgi:glycosyltransferase involved in cell wall biosynthesis
MNNLLSIIIPVFNVAENIRNTLNAIEEKIKTPHTIYIVYDFDEDNTLPVAQAVAAQGKSIIFVKNPLRGVASAIKTGLLFAEEPYLLVSMADMSDDYGAVDRMCRLMDNGYDVVCGSRYMRGGRQIGGGLLKKSLSKCAGLSLWYFAGLPTHDSTNSFKLYRRDMVHQIEIESNAGFEIGIEIVVKAFAREFKITEIPCTWQDRTAGQSRFKIFKWAPHYLKWYFYALRTRFHRCTGHI